MSAEILQKIIDPQPEYFAEAQEEEFYRQLRAKPVRMKRAGFKCLIAPTDIGAFKQRCDNHGLAQCDYAQYLIRFLLDNPKGWLAIHYEIPSLSPAAPV